MRSDAEGERLRVDGGMNGEPQPSQEQPQRQQEQELDFRVGWKGNTGDQG